MVKGPEGGGDGESWSRGLRRGGRWSGGRQGGGGGGDGEPCSRAPEGEEEEEKGRMSFRQGGEECKSCRGGGMCHGPLNTRTLTRTHAHTRTHTHAPTHARPHVRAQAQAQAQARAPPPPPVGCVDYVCAFASVGMHTHMPPPPPHKHPCLCPHGSPPPSPHTHPGTCSRPRLDEMSGFVLANVTEMTDLPGPTGMQFNPEKVCGGCQGERPRGSEDVFATAWFQKQQTMASLR